MFQEYRKGVVHGEAKKLILVATQIFGNEIDKNFRRIDRVKKIK